MRQVRVGQPRPLRALQADRAEETLIGPLKSKMNFQTYDDRQRAEHHRHEEEDAQDVPVFSVRLSAEGEQQPDDVGEDHRTEREEQRVRSARRACGVLEDADEVVQADDLEVPMPVQLVKAKKPPIAVAT